jgi:hypothetical protein
MTTPIYRQNASALTPVTFSAVASGSPVYSSNALRVQQSALSVPGALMADFRLTSITWGGTPASGGSIQLVAVDRDFSGIAGTAPDATHLPRLVGTFSPIETASASPGVMALNAVALSYDTDYYLANNGTGQTFTGTLNCLPWTPGT